MERDRTRDNPKLSRRKFLALTGSTTAAFILASCAAPAAPAPTAAPAAPAAPAPPKPTAVIAEAGKGQVMPTVVPAAKADFGPAETKKLVWATSNPNYASQAIIQIGVDKGYYKDEGLEIEIVNTENEKEGAIGGSVQVVHEDTGPMIDSIVKENLPMAMIAPWRTGEFQGYALRKEYKNGDDLDGKTLRTQTIGSREHLIHMRLLAENGFKVEGTGGTARPNWVRPAGGSDPGVMMFLEGKLDGTNILPRHIKQVEGYANIVTMTKLIWPQEGLFVTKAWEAKNGNTIKRFLRATIKAAILYTEGEKNKEYVINMMKAKGYSIPQAFVDSYQYEYVQFSNDMGYNEQEMLDLEKSFNFDPLPSTKFSILDHLWAAQEAMGFARRPKL